jgi:uncharacterized protein (DUF1697 family)
MLRGVNVGGHNKIKMDELHTLCTSLRLANAQTYLQSGNVVFRTDGRNLDTLAKKIQFCIERELGFRPEILLRTIPEMRDAIALNPFAKRRDIEPSKLAVVFLEAEPSVSARETLAQMEIAPEELFIIGRQLYIYFPNGQARPKISWSRVEKILGPQFTARNWNTVTKLQALAESLAT